MTSMADHSRDVPKVNLGGLAGPRTSISSPAGGVSSAPAPVMNEKDRQKHQMAAALFGGPTAGQMTSSGPTRTPTSHAQVCVIADIISLIYYNSVHQLQLRLQDTSKHHRWDLDLAHVTHQSHKLLSRPHHQLKHNRSAVIQA